MAGMAGSTINLSEMILTQRRQHAKKSNFASLRLGASNDT